VPVARTPSATGSRYLTLDAWRGIAALAVVGFHCVNTLVEPERSWISALLFHGWAGVYVFFPISGYCILAASHSRANPDVFTFLKRRWRRLADEVDPGCVPHELEDELTLPDPPPAVDRDESRTFSGMGPLEQPQLGLSTDERHRSQK